MPTHGHLTHIDAPANIFKIAQISDLHLSDESSFNQFLSVLTLALKESPDLLLLTGDLVNDGNRQGYDRLYKTLIFTKIPFLCLAGNHDVTAEIGHHLPFDERTFLPIRLDDRLPDRQRLTIKMANITWQILAINTAISGQIGGYVSRENLEFLSKHLTCNQPTIIAMHHHPQPVGSAWIDEYMLQNHDEFWQTLSCFDNIKAVICGHVHQAHRIDTHNTSLYTCPASSRQFLAYHDDFTIDDTPPGFRLIHICNKKTLATWVKRLQN
ncbi:MULTISPECIES: metallophosphoesterase [unclassified Moraxella]|uniref:metallophosphoesterase n=1 Tax=unclassified Moraxella TaxID=2685852 RepID=UPI00359EB7D0